MRIHTDDGLATLTELNDRTADSLTLVKSMLTQLNRGGEASSQARFNTTAKTERSYYIQRKRRISQSVFGHVVLGT